MKIGGREISGPHEEFIVIPRSDEDIVIRARAVLSYKEFEALCPVPKPPSKMMKGGKKVDDTQNKNYLMSLEGYAKKRTNWTIIQSLLATEGLEWDTVDFSQPDTWGNYESDLSNAGFSDIEMMRIVNMVWAANCLDENKLEEARNRFLLSQQEQVEISSSPEEEQPTTQSGEPANDLVSVQRA